MRRGGRNFYSGARVLPVFRIPARRRVGDELGRVEGNWKEFKGKVQQKWGKLTDDDMTVIEGKRSELNGRLQQRYGVAKDEADRQIDAWLNSTH
jgi:uncharacterized protein YjbJ (UPF0337 family)